MYRNLIGQLFPLLLLDAPDDGASGGVGDVADVALGQEGDLEILERGIEDEEKDDDATDDSEGDGTDEDDEAEGDGSEEFGEDEDDEKEAEEEGDEKEEKDDKEGEEKGFEGRPTLTDIKKKYPKIFKEFPDLREVLFRENEFSKHFGTVEEAESAGAKVQNFNVIEAALLAGDSSPILDQMTKNAPDALKAMVDNFLPSVLSRSQDLYLRATVPVIEQFLHTAYEHGKKTNDSNLMKSAQHAANFMFGKPDIPDPARRALSREEHPAEKKLAEERKTWAETRFKETAMEVSGEIDTEMVTEILKGFDPDGKVPERQRARFIKDVQDEIDATLGKDEAFQRQMKALWKKAADSNYPKDQRASIKSAFLARAKALVPAVRSRLRQEWFGRGGNSVAKPGDKNKQVQQPPKKRVIGQSGQAGGGGGKRPPSPHEVDYSKTSDMDLIEGKFARRK